ncbi:MAG: flagellar motor switch protein FliM [Brevinemataceae bacterium]
MTEILSQEEIDALLTAVSSTPIAAQEEDTSRLSHHDDKHFAGSNKKRLKVYDFRRPDKFSKDQVRTLQMIHETFARLTTTSLAAQLRSLVQVHVVSVDQLTYEEFTRSIPSPTTLGIVNMDPLKGSAVIEIDPAITFSIIDRLFGGKGETLKTNRELTDIEISVIEGILVRLLGNLRESWSNMTDLRPRLGNIETNPQFVGIVPPNSMVILTTFDTKIGDVEGMVNFCIPYITIEPIIGKLSAQYWYAAVNKHISTEHINFIKQQLNDIELTVIAQLADTTLSFAEVSTLKEGDVIRFDTNVNDDVQVYIGRNIKFKAKPGIFGSRRAIQLHDHISTFSEEDLHELLINNEE